MAQHLREGSVIHYGNVPGSSSTYANALVTNVTPAYLEFEWTDPATSVTHSVVRSWSSLTGVITVVTD